MSIQLLSDEEQQEYELLHAEFDSRIKLILQVLYLLDSTRLQRYHGLMKKAISRYQAAGFIVECPHEFLSNSESAERGVETLHRIVELRNGMNNGK